MMKDKIKILICSVIIIGFIQHLSGQNISNEEKLRKARILMSDYQDAALFRDMGNGSYDPSWEGIFKSLFKTNKIIFDIPVRVDDKRYHDGIFQLEPGADARVISLYQEQVSIDKYIETIRNVYDLFSITDFSYLFVETKFDTLALSSQNKIIFEFKKTFSNTTWSLRDSKNYIFEIQFFDGQPFITAVKLVDENIAKTDVILSFIDASRSSELAGLICHIRLEFDESINNTSLIATTDIEGMIKPGLLPNRAVIKIDSAYNTNGESFSIADEWRINGYKVSSQPSGGFLVPLKPLRWNGFSWSVKAYVGLISQSENQLGNFLSNSTFTNKDGSKSGIGLEVSRLISFAQISSVNYGNPEAADQSKIKRLQNTYLGLGAGIYFYQYQYQITSNGFAQKPYPYSDRREEPVLVFVNGSSFREQVAGSGIAIPVYFEFRKNIANKNAFVRGFSAQAGLNLMVPVETNYELSGTFTRHGYYEQFNQQLMTSDPFYNYYSSVEKTHTDEIINNDVMPEWMLRLNGYLNLSRGGNANLLDIGVMFTLPFSGSGTFNSDLSWIATGNDDFRSMSYSKTRVYNFFIGLSAGFNFIRYRL